MKNFSIVKVFCTNSNAAAVGAGVALYHGHIITECSDASRVRAKQA